MSFTLSQAEQAIIDQAISILESKINTAENISSPASAAQYLRLNFAMLEHEVFAVLWLNNKHSVIDLEVMFRGTIDAAAVYPREVVKAALAKNASAAILCHNHPSGSVEPSEADKAITRRLIEALTLVDVRVIDHMVVGTEGYTSFAERGLL
ncbi:DNA repair protein RadC [Marinobacter sp. Hex_13]|uniref:RadC family protein n=1 Tax=Marinobacter sp. Hex_13 TaxID=1795866 RepID=UPI000796D467|nr:DNA repair protein RadC [Marinobacter sp. Hex_13]KXJ45904.1 MAG: hypothetical protein AXW11_12505 [Marinobacter sp. Hex_13]